MLRISFNQARECVLTVFHKRGYTGGYDLIEILTTQELLALNDRSKLMDMMNALQLHADETKKQKKLARKLKK